MLLTEQQLSRRKNIVFPQPDRLKKVGKSMGAIKHVLGERKRERIRIHLEKKALEAQENVDKKAEEAVPSEQDGQEKASDSLS
jgi:large subunit ribosomal protein L47